MSSNLHEIIIRLKDEASKGIKSIENSAKWLLGSIENNKGKIQAIGAISAAAFAGIGMGVKSAISVFAEFEEKMSGVQAVLNPTAEEMEGLNKKAKELGASTKFSAVETAAGMEMLARNGLNATQILDGAFEATLSLASATGTDIATAADIATDAMGSFWLKVQDLNQVVNSITGVTNKAKFSIEDYKYALAAGGGVAAALGVELKDFNTVIAATATRFAGGSDAGTSFKTFMQRLVPQSKEATKEMIKLWLATADGKSLFYDASGGLKSMAEVSEILKEATKDLSEEQKNASLSVIFGSDALRTAIGLAEVGAEKFNELQTSIEGTDAAENAKIRMNNLTGSFEELNGAIDSIKLAIGSALAPTLKRLTIFFQDIAQKIGKWADENPELVNGIITISLAVTGLIAGFSGLALALWPIVAGFKMLWGAVAALFSPIGLVIGAIALFALAYTTNFMGFKDIVDKVVSWVTEKLSEFVGWLKDIFVNSNIAETFKELWGKAQEAVKIFAEMVKKFLQDVANFWEGWGDTIMKILENLWSLIGNAFSTAINSIIDIFQGLIDTLVGIFDVFAGLFTGNWSQLWDGVVGILKGIFGTIGNIVNNILNGVLNFIDTVFGTNLQNIWSNIWNALTDFISNIFSGKAMEAAGNALGSIANKALEWGANMIEMFKQWVQKKWGEFKNWVAESAWVLADFFGFHSPTKEWPNSDADKWMPNFIKMLSDGIKAGKWTLENSVESTAKAFVKINKWLQAKFVVKEFKKIQKSSQDAFKNISNDAEKSQKKIEKYTKELEKIAKKLVELENKFQDTDMEWRFNIAEKTIELEKELQELQTKSDVKEKDFSRIAELEKELEVARAYITDEEYKAALIESQKTAMQKMIEAHERKLSDIAVEIMKQTKLKEEKERAIKEEQDLHEKMMQTKKDLEAEYFALFQANLDKTKAGIQETISMMQTLRAMQGGDSGGGGTGARASGGSVAAGSRYMVGERWPELFIPNTNGYIVPNHELGGNATININMGGVVVTGEADENRLVQKISQKLRKEAKLYKLWIA